MVEVTPNSDIAFQRAPFGSAIDPVASLGSSRILRLSPHHPLGNYDDFSAWLGVAVIASS